MAGLLVVAATLAAFWPVSGAGFLSWRDGERVLDSALVQTRSFDRIWSEPVQSRYLPVAVSWWALLSPGSASAAPAPPGASAPVPAAPKWIAPSSRQFHQAQLVLAALCAWLAFWIFYRVTRHVAAATAAAIVFAVHPWQVEPVAWVSQAPQMLGLLLGLAALALYFTLATSRVDTPQAGRRNSSVQPLGYLAATLFYALALLADPLALLTPLFAWVIDWGWVRPRERKAPVPMRWALLVLWLFLGGMALVQIRFALPRPAVATVSWTEVFAAWPWLSIGALSVAVILIASAWLGRVDRTLTACGLLIVALLPAAGVWPGMVEAGLTAPVTVWALLGPAMALAGALSLCERSGGYALAAVLAGILLVTSHVEASSWTSDASLAARLERQNPRSPLASLLRARAASAQGETVTAQSALTEALERDPNFVAAMVERGSLSLAAGDKAAAESVFAAALKLAPDEVAALDGYGQSLSGSIRGHDAIAAFRRALKFDPHRAETHLHLGHALLHNGDTQGALASFETALSLRPGSAAAYLGLAMANSRFPEQDREAIYRSIDNAQKALQVNPQLAEARALLIAGHRRLSELLSAEGQTAAAEEELQAILQIAPDEFETLCTLGNLLLTQQRYAEAEARFKGSLGVQPSHLESRYGLGIAYWSLNNPAEAEACFREVLAARPNHPGSLYQLALIQSSNGRIAEALAGYRAALAEKDHFARWPSAANNLAWILATCEDEQYRNGEEAVMWAKQVFDLYLQQQPPDFLEYVDTLAAAYAEAGKFSDAIDLARRAVAMCDSLGLAEGKARFQRRLELYITGRQVREPISLAGGAEPESQPEGIPQIDPTLPPPDLDTSPAELPEAPEMPAPEQASTAPASEPPSKSEPAPAADAPPATTP
ncbi:MAG: tetratricopeptide repeat protein [Pirellulales bacterium]|nr:tetratricopeptide repeat protein [Pirellulales bacterium]